VEALGLFYARFMVDWVVVAPTRCKLRGAIKVVNQTLAELTVGKYPDKTFIGRVERGLSFSGYRFSSAGLCPAPQTIERFKAPMARLYERGADVDCIGQYARRWWRWVEAGVTLAACVGPACPASGVGSGLRPMVVPTEPRRR
jgi:hypothetical protein